MIRLNLFHKLRAFPGLEYLLAILMTGIFTLLVLPFRNDGGQDHTILSLLYLLPVVLSSVLWGLGPGALAAIASFLALNYFFVPPYYTLLVHRTQDFLVLIVFLGVSIVIGQLVGRVSKSLSETTAREYEATHLYELIMRLAGMQDEQEIVSALAEQALITLHAERVDVLVEAQEGLPARQVRLEDRSQIDYEAAITPIHIAPLQSTRVPGRDQGLAGRNQANPGRGTLAEHIRQPRRAGVGEGAPFAGGFTHPPAGGQR